MSMLMTVIAFLVTIGVLVVIHEYGHYRAAVACGVKVLRFSVGFGRVLWRRQRGETEFVLSALPLGGYVKMLDEREGAVDPAEAHRSFNRQSLGKRAFIVFAGPLANLLLAIALFAMVNWAGTEELRAWMAAPKADSIAAKAGLSSRDEILAVRKLGEADAEWVAVRSLGDLQWLLTTAALDGEDVRLRVARRDRVDGAEQGVRELTLPVSRVAADEVDARLLDRLGFTGPYTAPEVAAVLEGGPAEQGGLKAGDRVVLINDVEPRDAAELLQAIRGSAVNGQAQTLAMQVEREGKLLNLRVQPVMKDVKGEVLPRIDAALGSAPALVTVSYGPWEGFSRAVTRTWDVSVLSVTMLAKMVVGQASLQNLSGPITIADYAGRSATLGWVYYVGFLAMVSVSLGVLNLLPLPVLDGGHLMYYLFEAVTGRPVSELWLERLQRGGLAVMALLMSLALYNDLARLFGAH